MSAVTPLLGEKQTSARELLRSVCEYTASREIRLAEGEKCRVLDL
jgi:hypothetical protein